MLLDLQDDLVLRCLAGAGCRGLCAAAASCSRLAALAAALSGRAMFSSATEAGAGPGALPGVVAAAAGRAKEGLLGACDFALLFGMGSARGREGAAQAALRDALGLVRGRAARAGRAAHATVHARGAVAWQWLP